MARLGFCGPSYTSQAVSADAQLTRNFFLEQVESGNGKSAYVLLPTPGLSIFSNIAGAQVRGCYFEPVTGRAFAVIDGNFWEILADGTTLNRGAVNNDHLPASLTGWATVGGVQQILIASGQQGYVFDLVVGTLTAIPQGTLPSPLQLASSDTFFVALCGDNKIRSSASLDATTWPGLQLFTVSVFSDLLTSILVDHRELLVLGSKRGQFYYDSGSQAIFDVIPDGIMEQGSAARFGISRLGQNSLAWWGQNNEGGRFAWQANGHSPVRISTHAIEAEIDSYLTIADAFSYACQYAGHTFWRTTFPSALGGVGKTWQYDAATGTWAEVSYWDANNARDIAHRSSCHMFAFGRHLVGDSQSGVIYEMKMPTRVGSAWTFANDFGNVIRRVRRSPYIGKPEVWNFGHTLEIEADMGQGPLPALTGTPQGLTEFTLQDANGVLWYYQMQDSGQLVGTSGSPFPAQTIYIQDPTATTFWQLTAQPVTGDLSTTQVFTQPVGFYPGGIPFVTITGKQSQVSVDAAGHIQTLPPFSPARGPQGMIRFSKDGAQTWSNQRTVDFGQTGQYGVRAILRRLGRWWGTRGLVVELSYSDAVPLRITDAYIDADPELKPSERLTKQLARSA